MKTISFSINTRLITLNEYIQVERGNKFAAAKVKEDLTNKIVYLIKSQKVEKIEGAIDVKIEWFTKDEKQDADNIFFAVEFILDGLVSAKILKNDNRKFVRNISNTIVTDRDLQHNMCIVYLSVISNE